MKIQLTPIASAAALALMSTVMTAHAQQAAAAPAGAASAADGVQTVVVTGIRASLQQSINQKRNAESLVEVITAEDVGKMPDKNVADSLQRIPGVSTTTAGSAEGPFGENEHVQLRGLSSQLTLTTLNGHTVSTGDWYGPNIANGGRSVTYTLLPSDLIGRAVVHKSSQADLIEGGAAGSVDIETRKPTSFQSGLTTSLSLEDAYSSNAKKNDPAVSALLNWRTEDGRFGILGQAFSQSRHLQRAGVEGVWWDTVGPTYVDPTLRGKAISLLSGAVLFEQSRKREGGYIEAEWKPVKSLSLDLSGFYSRMDAKNYNTNYMADLINPFNGPGWNGNTVAPTGAVGVTGNTITSIFFDQNAFGATPPANAFSVVEDVAARPDARTDSKFINLDAKWQLSESTTLSGKLGRTLGGGHTKDVGFEVFSAWNQGVGYSTDSSGNFVLNVPNGDKYVRAGTVGGWGSMTDSVDSETYAQADLAVKLDNDYLPGLKFGARGASHRRQLTKLGMTLGAGADDVSQIPDAAVGNYSSGWAGSLPVNPTPNFSPWKISNDYVASWVDKYATFTTHATQQEFNIHENTAAAYGMADLAFGDRITGNAGVRIVQTSSNIEAFLPGGQPSYSQSFVNMLPSFNLRAELAHDLIGRVALNRALSRPDFGQMAGNDLRDTQHNGVGSNPYLKPILSNNADLSVEWYFSPKSLLTAGVFASNLQGVISYGHQMLPYANAAKGGAIEMYDVSSPINVDGEMRGFEAGYVQSFGGGFGVDLNFTSADGKQTTKLASGTCNGGANEDCSLYGTSKTTYNIGGYYENEQFSARIGYSHRSSYKLGNRGGNDYFQKGSGAVNIALNYNLNKMVQFTFEGQNLNDPLQTVYVGDETRVAGVYKNGKTLYAGVRVKF